MIWMRQWFLSPRKKKKKTTLIEKKGFFDIRCGTIKTVNWFIFLWILNEKILIDNCENCIKKIVKKVYILLIVDWNMRLSGYLLLNMSKSFIYRSSNDCNSKFYSILFDFSPLKMFLLILSEQNFKNLFDWRDTLKLFIICYHQMIKKKWGLSSPQEGWKKR